MFKCNNITVIRQHRRLLDNIHASFAKGRITAIIGANGAGKSTLLKVLLGEFPELCIDVKFHSRYLNDYCLEELAKQRAYVSQHNRPAFSLAVFEYLLLARELYCEPCRQSHAIVQKIADMFDITRLLERDLGLLSGGEAQLIEFARAYLQLYEENGVEDKCLLLDEPASALDIKQTSQLYQHMLNIRAQGATIILVDHDINAMAAVADDIMLLKQGQLLAHGCKSKVYTAESLNLCFDVDGTFAPLKNDGSIYSSSYQ